VGGVHFGLLGLGLVGFRFWFFCGNLFVVVRRLKSIGCEEKTVGEVGIGWDVREWREWGFLRDVWYV
jgi:hypothetical protein